MTRDLAERSDQRGILRANVANVARLRALAGYPPALTRNHDLRPLRVNGRGHHGIVVCVPDISRSVPFIICAAACGCPRMRSVTAVVVRNLGRVVAGHGLPSRGHHTGLARQRHCRFSPGMSFRCGSAAFSSICRGRSSRVLDAFLGEAAGRLTGGSPSFRRAVLRNLTETWPDFRNLLFCDRLVAVS